MGCSCFAHSAFISFILYLPAHEIVIEDRFLHVALERTPNYSRRDNQMNTKRFVNGSDDDKSNDGGGSGECGPSALESHPKTKR